MKSADVHQLTSQTLDGFRVIDTIWVVVTYALDQIFVYCYSG